MSKSPFQRTPTKASCCVLACDGKQLPAWFRACNGKIYFDDTPQMQTRDSLSESICHLAEKLTSRFSGLSDQELLAASSQLWGEDDADVSEFSTLVRDYEALSEEVEITKDNAPAFKFGQDEKDRWDNIDDLEIIEELDGLKVVGHHHGYYKELFFDVDGGRAFLKGLRAK